MNVLVVAPHPDDETLGAGGTILKLKEEGHKVFWLIVTDAGINQGWDETFLHKRKKQIEEITDFFKFDKVFNLNYQPASLDSVHKDKIISDIHRVFDEVKPNWVILPNRNDVHSDHKVVFDCCMTCTKSFRFPSVRKLTTMEILSETEFGGIEHMFAPNYYVDITNQIDKKIEALQIYDTELGVPPFPRSIDAVYSLATIRGGVAGCRYAEAFQIVRMID